VPGTGLSPDKMLMGRIFSYHDTHLHRIGSNYQQLPIIAPISPVHTYTKDGFMAVKNAGNQPVYAPNSYGGPAAGPQRAAELNWWVEAGELGRYVYTKHRDDDNFVQPRVLVEDVMTETDREHLVPTSPPTSRAA
jgi:catalase